MHSELQSCMMSGQQYTDHYISSSYQHQSPPCYSAQCYPQYNYNQAYAYSNQCNADVQYLLDNDHYSHIQIPAGTSMSTTTRRTPSSPTKRPVKPPYSYAALICMAIDSTNEKKATMREILAYIEQHFAYYRLNKKWHGTIRHDLTVNDCFMKMDPRPGQKACLWSVNPEFQDMFSSGSMRRRRYRFKQGSSSWLKSRKQSAAKRHKTKHMEQANIISLSCSLGNSNCSLTSSQNSSCDELTDIVTSCHNLNQCYTQNSAVQPSTSNTLDDVFCNIPSFDDCIDELFHSFQTDYYNTL